MNTLLIFFALPLATIIISIALQKIFRNPLLVAAIIFAIFLIVTFVIGDLNFLIATIIYTIIAFVTASIVKIINKLIRWFRRHCNDYDNNDSDNDNDNDNSNNGGCGCNSTSAVTASNISLPTKRADYNAIDENISYNNENNCSWNCSTNSNGVTARINIIPNSNTNDRMYRPYGRYRGR